MSNFDKEICIDNEKGRVSGNAWLIKNGAKYLDEFPSNDRAYSSILFVKKYNVRETFFISHKKKLVLGIIREYVERPKKNHGRRALWVIDQLEASNNILAITELIQNQVDSYNGQNNTNNRSRYGRNVSFFNKKWFYKTRRSQWLICLNKCLNILE